MILSLNTILVFQRYAGIYKFAEGYATAATLYELTGLPVIVAFNSGTLPAVAECYQDKYPDKTLVIAGDNDPTKPIEKNVGRLKAQKAAQMVGGFAPCCQTLKKTLPEATGTISGKPRVRLTPR
jgi:phage/plasmid primase-like uncharacterized protein